MNETAVATVLAVSLVGGGVVVFWIGARTLLRLVALVLGRDAAS